MSRIAAVASISPSSLDAGEADLDRELGAVLAHREQLDAGAHRPGSRLGEVVGPMLWVGLAEAPWDEQLDQLADQLLPPVAEELLGLAVDEDDLAVAIDPHDRVGHQLQELLEVEPVPSGIWPS